MLDWCKHHAAYVYLAFKGREHLRQKGVSLLFKGSFHLSEQWVVVAYAMYISKYSIETVSARNQACNWKSTKL